MVGPVELRPGHLDVQALIYSPYPAYSSPNQSPSDGSGSGFVIDPVQKFNLSH